MLEAFTDKTNLIVAWFHLILVCAGYVVGLVCVAFATYIFVADPGGDTKKEGEENAEFVEKGLFYGPLIMIAAAVLHRMME